MNDEQPATQQPAAADTTICPNCKGSGEVMGRSWGAGPDDYETECACGMCNGTGEQPAAASTGADSVHRHVANEWADMATNGLQYLRNVRDGICTLDEALAGLMKDYAHCRDVNDNPPWGRAALQSPQVPARHFPFEFEVWLGDELCASASGPRDEALREAMGYAVQYGQDGPVRIFEVTRTLFAEATQSPPAATAQQREAPLHPGVARTLLRAGEKIVVMSEGKPLNVTRIEPPSREGACFYACGPSFLPYKVMADGRMERPDLRLSIATPSPAHPAAGESTERGSAA